MDDVESSAVDATDEDHGSISDDKRQNSLAKSTELRNRLQQFKYVTASNTVRRSPRLKARTSSDEETGLEADNDTLLPTHGAGASKNVIKTASRQVLSLTPITSPLPKRKRTSQDSPTPSPARRTPSKYAAPSRYAHLKPLTDVLSEHLLLVFVGVNPGISTAVAGHAYAHPSNRFWHLLHTSGLTPERKLSHTEDRNLPRLYAYGNTNIVERPTKDQGELSKEEMVAGTAVLEDKFRRFKPEAVCIVGKGIWEAIWRYRYGRNITKAEFHYGWQDEKENMGCSGNGAVSVDGESQPWPGARVFVATSTSGQAAHLRPEEKLAIWKPLGEWAQQRRKDRAANGIFTGIVGSSNVVSVDSHTTATSLGTNEET